MQNPLLTKSTVASKTLEGMVFQDCSVNMTHRMTMIDSSVEGISIAWWCGGASQVRSGQPLTMGRVLIHHLHLGSVFIHHKWRHLRHPGYLDTFYTTIVTSVTITSKNLIIRHAALGVGFERSRKIWQNCIQHLRLPINQGASVPKDPLTVVECTVCQLLVVLQKYTTP